MARYMQHYHFDPCGCGRKWATSFLEGSHRFTVLSKWDMKITASADHNVSKWGAGSSETGESIGDWDKVTEFKLAFKTELKRDFKRSSIFISADFQNVWIDGGPVRNDDYFSVMTFSTQQNSAGLNVRLMHKLSRFWFIRGGGRIEKNNRYSKTGLLPELTVFFDKNRTSFGLSFITGQRYMDSWFRVGSDNFDPNNTIPLTPYLIPTELSPEKNSQLKFWLSKNIKTHFFINGSLFLGKHSHLMGYDWDFALEKSFNQVKAFDLGNYSYWGGDVSLEYKRNGLRIGSNISVHGISSTDLDASQLYVTKDASQPLYIPKIAANFFLDWNIIRKLSLFIHFNTLSGTSNAGIDFDSFTYNTVFNTSPYLNTSPHSTLNLSLISINIIKKIDLQLTIHNALDNRTKLPIVQGGIYTSRGREFSISLRKKF